MASRKMILGTVCYLAFASVGLGKQLACNDEIPMPEYFGSKVTKLSAHEVHDWNEWSPEYQFSGFAFEEGSLDFCNVTLTYTHPGYHDTIHIYLWLPLEGWNGNLLAQGGGGWSAGSEGSLAPAVARGYAGVNTDAGHTYYGDRFAAIAQADSWALKSPGNVDLVMLQNFASRALDDMANLGKEVVKAFYGNPPKYSYWNGCSTGGRQGLIQAQRFAENFNGILAIAPAINWDTFLPVEQWGQLLMSKEKYWPSICETDAITAAAIEACDELDGVKDGVIAATDSCTFDAESVVGQKYECNGDTRKISKAAARIVNGVWRGTFINGKQEWFGLSHDADLAVPQHASLIGGLLNTTCDGNMENCVAARFPISENWVRLFLKKDPDYNLDSMTEDDFVHFLHMSRQQYASIMGSADPDLSAFRRAGGKMITWHGLADQLIFPNGSRNYYERVLALDKDAADFYRYYEPPGVAHCALGPGAFPHTAFDSLVDWVEHRKAPEHLDAATTPMTADARVRTRPVCRYPQVAAFQGGDPDVASSYKCSSSFGTKKAADWVHGEL